MSSSSSQEVARATPKIRIRPEAFRLYSSMLQGLLGLAVHCWRKREVDWSCSGARGEQRREGVERARRWRSASATKVGFFDMRRTRSSLRLFPPHFRVHLSLVSFIAHQLPRLPTPHVYLPRRQVPQNRRLGRERLQALRRRGANVAHWRGSDRRREVNRAPKEDAKKEFERTFVARPVKFSAHPLSPRLSPHK